MTFGGTFLFKNTAIHSTNNYFALLIKKDRWNHRKMYVIRPFS